MPDTPDTTHPDDAVRPAMPVTRAGPGAVEIGAVRGQVVVYIGVLDHHVAFSPEQAVQFATLILEKVKTALTQITIEMVK